MGELLNDASTEKKFAKLDETLSSIGRKAGMLIPILQNAQEIFGYLPKEVLIRISDRTDVPISQIYGVVTFYAQFHLSPRGRNIIRSCQGTACHVRGAKAILQKINECIDLPAGAATTKDLRFTLETVACIGCCGLAPVLMVNDETHGRLAPGMIQGILDRYK
jgi:NADH:ubiquinone oxidoreductase subunit E